MSKALWLVVPALLVALLLAGCDGGGANFFDFGFGSGTLTAGDRALPDGSRIDFLTFRAIVAGIVFISMRGSGANPVDDPFLWVFPGRVNTVAEAVDLINNDDFVSDDDSGPGLNAELLLAVDDGEVFTVGFNSFDGNDLGNYRWIVDYVGNVAGAGTAAAESGDKPNNPATARAKAQAR